MSLAELLAEYDEIKEFDSFSDESALLQAFVEEARSIVGVADALREIRDIAEDAVDYDTPVLHQILNVLDRKAVREVTVLPKVEAQNLATGMKLRKYGGYVETVQYVVAAGNPSMCKLVVTDPRGARRERTYLRTEKFEVLP